MFSSKKKRKLSRIDNTPITTVIGSEISIRGEIQGNSTVKIDGKIIGNVSVEKGIILGDKSFVNGNIESSCVIVYGKVDGNITCKELTIKSSGVINGDITTDILQVDIGGKYNGRFTTVAHQPEQREVKKQEKK